MHNMFDVNTFRSAERGFVKMVRGDEIEFLLRKDHKALALLIQVALRARWRRSDSPDGLQPGQCWIGDHETCGLSPKEYRNAKMRLVKYGFAAFTGTTSGANRGTVATLLNARVFDIMVGDAGKHAGEQGGEHGANMGRTRGDKQDSKTVRPKDNNPDFDLFWTAYPRKVAKQDARKAWDKATGRPSVSDILAAIDKAKASDQWARDGGQFIPYPATWINRGGWEDELSTLVPPSASRQLPTTPQVTIT